MDTNEQQQQHDNTNCPLPHKRKWKWKYLLILPVLGLSLYIMMCGTGALCFLFVFPGALREQPDPPWIECQMQVPGEIKVVFLRKHAHEFLAEYDRKLRIERPGEQPVIIDLPPNTGGSTMINVYTCCTVSPEGEKTPMLLLVDRQYEMLVNLKHAEMANDPRSKDSTKKALESIFEKQYKYIGRLDDREIPLQFIPVSQATKEAIDKP